MIFKVLYSYDNTDGVTLRPVVMVKASDVNKARDKVAKYFLSSVGVRPSFRIHSVKLSPHISNLIV